MTALPERSAERLTEPFAAVGRLLLAFAAGAGRVVTFSTSSVVATLTSGVGLSLTAAQAVHLVKRCLIPVVLVVGPVGGMLAMQSLSLTAMFGVDRLLAPLITATVVRELSPGFSAVMVAFQAGAGIAAELGTMRVKEELDALDVMGLDARRLVVGPRILGAAICAPILNAVGIAVGIGAAYGVSVGLYGLPHGMFAEGWLEGITVLDLWVSELKSVVFGLLLGGVAATFGFFTTGGTAGVGRSTNRTVVATVILVLCSNYLLNTALFGLAAGSQP